MIATMQDWTLPTNKIESNKVINDYKPFQMGSSNSFFFDSGKLKYNSIVVEPDLTQIFWGFTMATTSSTGQLNSGYTPKQATVIQEIQLSEKEKLDLALSCFGAWKDRDDINDNWLNDLRSGWDERLNDLYGEEKTDSF